MKTTILVFAATLFQGLVMAQAPIIFQPGPGLNDGTDMGTIDAGMDATVNESTPAINYGDNSAMVSLPPSYCNETEVEAYIRFDVSSLPANVDSVFLNFYHLPQTNYCYSNCDSWWFFSSLDTEWDEMTVNWTDKLDYGTAFYDSIHFVFPDTGGWHRYDITSQYNNWKSGVTFNYGLAIYSTTEGCNNAAIMFYVASSDDTTDGGIYRPYLEVYETPNDVNPALKDNLAVTVYPNPSNDIITLNYDLFEPMPVGLRLQGLDGRTWFSQSATEQGKGIHSTPINITKLAAGIYMLVVETPIGTIREKVLVQ